MKFGSYKFVVMGTYGRDIGEFSKYPNEKEVLFVPGTQLRVVEVTDTETKLQERTMILLCFLCWIPLT